jgi:hypothetical protein
LAHRPPVYFPDRLLSRLLRKKGWGTNVIESITGSLRRLRLTPLLRIKSFHFNRRIRTNLQANNTKPPKEPFADLGLTGASYRFKSNRKQKLQRALQELQGIRLNRGVLRSATIVETAGGQDYKVVFVKGAARETATAADADALPAPEPVVINHYAKAKDETSLQDKELVRHLHQTFHGITAHEPQTKETNQALSFVSQHGLEKAKDIVTFAAAEAAKARFAPRNFGAVLNYISAALADLDRQKQPVPKPAVRQQPEWVRGERRAGILTGAQYAVRFEQAKCEVFRENPFLAQRWKPDSAIHERTIRLRVFQSLDTEVMDLIPAAWVPAWFQAATGGSPARKNRPS